jgi:EpsI family protein
MDKSGIVGEKSAPLISRRHVLIGGAMAASSALAFARQPQSYSPVVRKELFEKWIPKKFGEWSLIGSSGVVLPPPDALSDRLYDNLITRVYERADAPPVMLLLAYNNLQDGIVQVHRPEVCYPVGGYELSATREVPILVRGREIPANLFTAKGPDRIEQVLYFTRLGNAYPRSWGEQRWSVIQANLGGRIPDGLMLRVSMLGGDQALALPLLSGFTSNFIAASPSGLRNLILV